MVTDTNTVVSISEANHFSAAERAGASFVNSSSQSNVTYTPASDEEVAAISAQLMEQNDVAYKELSK